MAKRPVRRYEPKPKPAAAKLPAYRPGAGKFGGVPGQAGQAGFADAIASAVGSAIKRFTGTPLMNNPPMNVPWGGGKFGALPTWAAAAQIPRYGSPSQFRSLEEQYHYQPLVRQGVMTKARAPVTARPYVQLEPPAEEQMAAPAYAGAEPFYPYPDYGGGYPETGGGYGGGYGDGGGGGGAPREVPPWYYGLVSWRF